VLNKRLKSEVNFKLNFYDFVYMRADLNIVFKVSQAFLNLILNNSCLHYNSE